MVIEGLRYGSSPLLEMRIHDITLEVDLARHDPLNPTYPPPSGDPENDMEYDGTNDGLSGSQKRRAAIHAEEKISEATSCVEIHWTG